MTLVLFNGTKYLQLIKFDESQKKSLYSNIYYMLGYLRFAHKSDDTGKSHQFEYEIKRDYYTGEIMIEKKSLLTQYDFLDRLETWLKTLNKDDLFEFDKKNNPIFANGFDEKSYIKYDDWWVQFEELRFLIKSECIQKHGEYINNCTQKLNHLKDDYDSLDEL